MRGRMDMDKSILVIAGSDSIAGAGIQIDMKVACAHGVYATFAITAVTAQNTPSGKRTSIRWLPLSSFRPGLMNKR